MTESKIYADNFKCSFGDSDQFLDFLKERKEKSLWMKAPSNSLQFKPLEKDSELGSLYMQLYQTNGSAEILVDTMENMKGHYAQTICIARRYLNAHVHEGRSSRNPWRVCEHFGPDA